MVLDPIPQSLPVHFVGSRPQPPTSRGVLDSRYVRLFCMCYLRVIYMLFTWGFFVCVIFVGLFCMCYLRVIYVLFTWGFFVCVMFVGLFDVCTRLVVLLHSAAASACEHVYIYTYMYELTPNEYCCNYCVCTRILYTYMHTYVPCANVCIDTFRVLRQLQGGIES